ncbi:MAG: DUF3761 domain-containing protein [Edaphobacter sp.]|uniref:DUF3761 domain-containing protein n=1 Tax=Edaphobacter sp. TaxID=1934404 RepID=UPI00239ADB84|nr:DUF3761 domain-containing protein [Edaphobacter sp.]MDE1176050.1 DUF3761 domain-containing protein [Edaphobacter sp.]
MATLTSAFALLFVPAALSQTPPAGATGVCKDGTYSQAASKSGACRGHQGIKEWYAASAATPAAAKTATSAPAATPAPAPAPAPKATPAAPAAPAAASAKMSPSARAATVAQAPGGGPGMVWFNSESKVYHCPGTTFYGKTKQGQYMSEADAKAKGGHADHNHPCTK